MRKLYRNEGDITPQFNAVLLFNPLLTVQCTLHSVGFCNDCQQGSHYYHKIIGYHILLGLENITIGLWKADTIAWLDKLRFQLFEGRQ